MEEKQAVKPLQYVSREYRVVDYSELERLIREVYGKLDFCFPLAADVGNHSVWDCQVTGDESVISGWGLPRWLSGERKSEEHMAHAIMQDLCVKGYLVPGYYLVEVCW